jgi:hypothetical protein
MRRYETSYVVSRTPLVLAETLDVFVHFVNDSCSYCLNACNEILMFSDCTLSCKGVVLNRRYYYKVDLHLVLYAHRCLAIIPNLILHTEIVNLTGICDLSDFCVWAVTPFSHVHLLFVGLMTTFRITVIYNNQFINLHTSAVKI